MMSWVLISSGKRLRSKARGAVWGRFPLLCELSMQNVSVITLQAWFLVGSRENGYFEISGMSGGTVFYDNSIPQHRSALLN